MEYQSGSSKGAELRQQLEMVCLEASGHFEHLPVWRLHDSKRIVVRRGDACILAELLEQNNNGLCCRELRRVEYDCELKLVSVRVLDYEEYGFVKLLFSDLETMDITVRRLYLSEKR